MMRSFDISGFSRTCLKSKFTSLCFLLRRQVADVHHDGEAIGRRFRQRERALSELDRVHRRDGEAEGRQFVGGLADGDGAVLQAFEKRALRLERDAVDFVEQDHLGRRQRPELGDQLAGRRVDHLEADDFGRLQVGAALDARELGVADGGEDDAEERLADAGHAAQQQVAGVDLALLLLVVRGRNLRQQHDVGERLGRVVADERLAAFGDDRLVKVDGFLEVRMHGGLILSQGDGAKGNGIVYRTRVFPSCLADQTRISSGGMHGLMMEYPLTIPAIVRRAQKMFGHRPISGRRPDRSVTRTTYAVALERTRRLGAALTALGIGRGDRVATLAWASQEHLEAYLAIPSIGAVLHTLNLRLHHDDLSYIVNDAQDRVLILDESLLPLFETFRSLTPSIEHVVVIASSGDSADRLQHGFIDYESLLASADPDVAKDVALAEDDAAAMCYTSGTTGRPKGVLYSHRALVLHSFSQGLVDSLAIGERDNILPIVPMFHVNAWGLPFTATMFGAGQVFPGAYLDGASVLDLIVRERVTLTAGVPTVWLGMLQELDRQPGAHDLSALRTIAIGGSAAPASLIAAYQERHNLRIVHAWGMTELTPLGTVCNLPLALEDAPFEDRCRYRARQGKPLPFVEIRAIADGKEVPWDGKTMGELEVRGPWVARQYYNVEGTDSRFSDDGWFRTGDVVLIHPDGCVELTDRAKDLVKSGGEWISSVAIECALMAHPAVAEAAVIAVPHPTWDERPLAVVVLRPGQMATADELRDFLAPNFAKWWLPDTIAFASEIPRTSVGKFRKSVLREAYKDVYAKPR